jgi:hypothetical protein
VSSKLYILVLLPFALTYALRQALPLRWQIQLLAYTFCQLSRFSGKELSARRVGTCLYSQVLGGWSNRITSLRPVQATQQESQKKNKVFLFQNLQPRVWGCLIGLSLARCPLTELISSQGTGSHWLAMPRSPIHVWNQEVKPAPSKSHRLRVKGKVVS